MLHVFLSHGLESGPDSTKVQALKSEAEAFTGVTAQALDHRSTKDPAERLAQMKAAMAEANADPARTVLVGSSMGGWVCAQTSAISPVRGCFLLAPALAMEAYPESSPIIQAKHTQIIHGWHDDVVLPMPVIELARDQDLPLLALPDGHRLQNSLPRLVAEFRQFMTDCLTGLND
ncbi:YqiA/YcfP family alpha/beta fold hydrolase [Marinobacter sp. CHS3-4]|uniref:alpha/beta fold hydrolase n=1 Tax=Marinobacter sp. CHS3-4 TaxID=3045174 RepID=UPI0024B5233E|nr:YqiA/YcfP family alpha/beta fold hydrolase [Marinobacter sp. CHS3-4]MDI9246342.1 YqiA/YcfP family alpha/beta fold hydrolase [Marinobacter sp. CHS3-4]